MLEVKEIYKRDRKICHLCHRRVARNDASRDHIRPRSLGGPDYATNLRLAHRLCNSRRGSLRVGEARRLLGVN